MCPGSNGDENHVPLLAPSSSRPSRAGGGWGSTGAAPARPWSPRPRRRDRSGQAAGHLPAPSASRPAGSCPQAAEGAGRCRPPAHRGGCRWPRPVCRERRRRRRCPRGRAGPRRPRSRARPPHAQRPSPRRAARGRPRPALDGRAAGPIGNGTRARVSQRGSAGGPVGVAGGAASGLLCALRSRYPPAAQALPSRPQVRLRRRGSRGGVRGALGGSCEAGAGGSGRRGPRQRDRDRGLGLAGEEPGPAGGGATGGGARARGGERGCGLRAGAGLRLRGCRACGSWMGHGRCGTGPRPPRCWATRPRVPLPGAAALGPALGGRCAAGVRGPAWSFSFA